MRRDLEKQLSLFVENLKAQLFSDGVSLASFITEHTYLKGKKFSFEGHEFQEYICDVVDKSFGKTVSVKKLSQIGLSECFNRIVLAIMATRPGTGAIVSFPSKGFSQEVFKTRFAPIIDESPRLVSLKNRDVDSASVKQFTNGSIAYALGGNTSSNSTLLNRPANLFLIDERDRQDVDIISGFTSRTGHAKEEEILTLNISTPTVKGIGIDAEIEESREIHTPWVKCGECSHEFIADYYRHVILPGFDKNLLYLTKTNAANLDLSLAYLECPECKGKLTKHNKSTVWKITVNDKGSADKVGIVLDPFVAMGFKSVGKIVKDSVTYTSTVEFLNQGLGRCADVKDSSISFDSIKVAHDESPGLPIFGLDMGKLCHYMRGVLKFDTTIHVHAIEIIPLPELEEFISNEFKKFYFAAGVMDAQPYSDLVYSMIRNHSALFSAIYVDPKTPLPEVFTLAMRDKYDQIVRQINITKNLAMSNFASELEHFYTFSPCENYQTMTKHFLDMRKVRDYDYVEPRYKWVKSSQGEDHLFHSAIYLSMAAKLAQAGVARSAATFIGLKSFNPARAKARAY